MRSYLEQGDVEASLRLLGRFHSQVPITADGRDASTTRLRVATTTLVHGLIRRGDIATASDIVADALQGRVPRAAQSSSVLPLSRRVRFRTPTLQSTLSSLCHNQGQSHSTYLQDHRDLRHWRDVVQAQVALVSPKYLPSQTPEAARSYEYAQRSIALLNAFRHHRYRRTETMYEKVINTCIIHGEIITATLLFVLLVKDWQVKQAVQAAISSSAPTSSPSLDGAGHLASNSAPRDILNPILQRSATAAGFAVDEIRAYGVYKIPIPYPTNSMLQRILAAIPPAIDPGGIASGRDPDWREAKEALAYLACLLSEQCYPNPRLSSLIQSLAQHRDSADLSLTMSSARRRWRACFSSPASPSFAGLPRPDPHLVVNLIRRNISGAKGSVNELYTVALRDLITSSIRSRPKSRLDQRSYNALLHFALRDVGSVDLTRAVLFKMHASGHAADIVTLNTLIRGASLLRMNSAVEALASCIDQSSLSSPKEIPTVRLSSLLQSSRVQPTSLRPSAAGKSYFTVFLLFILMCSINSP